MPGVLEAQTGLEFYDLSHPWGFGTPVWPGFEGVRFEQGAYHARHGTLTQRFATVMHASTHVNAPVHLVPMAASIDEIALERFFGPGRVVSIPKGKWELIEAEDLQRAAPDLQAGEILLIDTGWHRRRSDSYGYFGEAPGLSPFAAAWLVERKVKLVGVDLPAIDHPLATSLALHRNGPIDKRVVENFKRETGKNPKTAFPDWNPAHRMLLAAGIPTVEELGGEVAALAGRKALICAFPWRWLGGDASIVRVVAIAQPAGKVVPHSGAAKLHDLTHPWGHSVSFWPGKNPIADCGAAAVPDLPGHPLGRARDVRDHARHARPFAGRRDLGGVRHRRHAIPDGGSGGIARRPCAGRFRGQSLSRPRRAGAEQRSAGREGGAYRAGTR